MEPALRQQLMDLARAEAELAWKAEFDLERMCKDSQPAKTQDSKTLLSINAGNHLNVSFVGAWPI